jgi:hypothetical protein
MQHHANQIRRRISASFNLRNAEVPPTFDVGPCESDKYPARGRISRGIFFPKSEAAARQARPTLALMAEADAQLESLLA